MTQLCPEMTANEKTTTLFTVMAIMIIILCSINTAPIEYYRQYFAQWTASNILYEYRIIFYYLQNLALNIMLTREQAK